ncbi:MAG: pilus assembly PilX N-terminal domain-containing protein [bacterium]|nr:pilus assembly PilX N-terminal domain-containing protein [bacterium]
MKKLQSPLNFQSDDLRDRGFTLLVALMTGVLLLSIGLAIMGISLKEVQLSASGRDSQFAFYAADSGMECALLWDRVPPDPDMEESPFMSPAAYNNQLVCNGSAVPWTNYNEGFPVPGGYATSTEFVVNYGKECAVISVVKNFGGQGKTVIHSRGRTYCSQPGRSDRVERGIKAEY